MKPGDPVTVWVERIGPKRGYVCDSDPEFERHMTDRIRNGLSGLFEWETAHLGTVRLADAEREGIDWLPGHGEEIENALRATRALA